MKGVCPRGTELNGTSRTNLIGFPAPHFAFLHILVLVLFLTSLVDLCAADLVLYAFWDRHTMPLTLEGDGESFTFADRSFIRIGKDRVEVSGDCRRLRLHVSGQPQFLVNGKRFDSRIATGCLLFGD